MISEILTKKNEAIKIIRLVYKIPIDNGNKKSKIISEVNLSHSDENIAEATKEETNNNYNIILI